MVSQNLFKRRPVWLGRWFAVIAGLALSGSTAVAAQSTQSKIAQDLENGKGAGAIDVIVQFTSPVQQRHLDKVAAHGGTYKAKLTGIQGGAFSLPASAIK